MINQVQSNAGGIDIVAYNEAHRLENLAREYLHNDVSVDALNEISRRIEEPIRVAYVEGYTEGYKAGKNEVMRLI